MFAKITTVAAVSASFVVAVSALSVNTPASLVQCQPALLSWGDGVAPFFLAIIPGAQPSAAALVNLPTQSGLTYTWTVNLNPGQEVTVKITDSTGAVNYSDKVMIQAGTGNSCMSGSAAGAGAAAASTPAAAAATTSSARAPLATTANGFTPIVTSAAASATQASSSASSVRSSVSSAINANANAASSSSPASAAASASSKPNSANSLKAATGLLVGGLVLALAA